jgi:hypothetical protein
MKTLINEKSRAKHENCQYYATYVSCRVLNTFIVRDLCVCACVCGCVCVCVCVSAHACNFEEYLVTDRLFTAWIRFSLIRVGMLY